MRRPLGQHFLNDPKILGRIVDALDPVPGETVLEIGPGRGSLTRVLLERGLRVTAIEKDRRFVGPGVIHGDALKVEWPRVGKIIGNIPYYITSPLIEKALMSPFECVVFLVQAEVAERIVATHGKTYGALSVGVQAVARVEKLFSVAPGSFRPPPKVRSAVIRLRPLENPLVRPEEVVPFRVFVTACFSKRRKQLKNAVPGLKETDLRSLGFDPAVRPERLTPDAFIRLFRETAR